MSYTLAVDVDYTLENLLKNLSSIVFTISTLLPYLIYNIATLKAFAYNKEVVFVLVYL